MSDGGILSGLNPGQLEAVTTTEGYVRVRAGPGTGKTRALTRRYAYLIAALGISARNILGVTFTNKAAREMRERILRLCGGIVNPRIATFHGFCASFLREEITLLGFPKNFTVLSVADVRELLKPLYGPCGLNGRKFPLRKAWAYIDGRKFDPEYLDPMLDPDFSRVRALADDVTLKPAERLFWSYVAQERQSYSLDFDDLIMFTLRILKRFPEVRTRWQQQFQYILVDEFQDIDSQQNELVEILSAAHHNLFIVGDPDQTIFSFRGADVKFFMDFDLNHPGTTSVTFTENYRTHQAILDCAHTMVSLNPDRTRLPLTPVRQDITLADMVAVTPPPSSRSREADEARRIAASVQGALSLPRKVSPPEPAPEPRRSLSPILAYCEQEADEAEFVARTINTIRREHPKAQIAILYRAHHVSVVLEKTLMHARIPYRIIADTKLFDRLEIRDVIAYLRLILNPRDNEAFVRIANEGARGFGKSRLGLLQEIARAEEQALFPTLAAHLDDPKLGVRPPLRAFVNLMAELQGAARLSPDAEIERLLEVSGYEERLKKRGEQERLESLKDLRQMAAEFQKHEGEACTAADFLNHLALFGTSAEADDGERRVELMTIHNAKGLEYDYVFITGLREKIFPSAQSQTSADLAEERRLLYVAMTRARLELFMTTVTGESDGGGVSRFVRDLKPEEVMEIGERPPAESGLGAGGAGSGIPSFAVGDRIFHAIIGAGEILAVDPETREYLIRFDKLSTPRTLSFQAPLRLQDAPLEELTRQ